MKHIIVEGGHKLAGTIHVSGAKNAVLPLIAAAMLPAGVSYIEETPWLTDVENMCEVLDYLGVSTEYKDGTLRIDATELADSNAPFEAVQKMRASFLVMGPLLARLGRARIPLPGGCAIGARPIDLHLKGFEAMGAGITISDNYIEARVNTLHGARIYLDFPSVGATENIMMAAALAEGNTVIENAAKEPEIVDLANLLNAMGGKVRGAGTDVVRISGVPELHPAVHTVIPDRIEAGSFMLMAAVTGSELFLENVITSHLQPIMAKMQDAGVRIIDEIDRLHILPADRFDPVEIKTMPYPGFPTDMQAQFMAFLTLANGTSTVTETVFENRFMHVPELCRMGAQISVHGNTAIVNGVPKLKGTCVEATDLRAGAAMIVAGLAAEGRTVIGQVDHIYRGYEDIIGKLRAVGAHIYEE
ncbi:MAG: UDP-N-acetylglucosamine 1-carboxyvinyltransferase [Firmicutes bacterium]|nr:UDP-N-acetylglucosamine 1-carboxyvinyltransferase [Bacillota bacterium]